jgi:2-polyprenyl-3-methyl-5-hydroxy-6-metoxy-1,4-benzoquinol methylase
LEEQLNKAFYNQFWDRYDKVPFDTVLQEICSQYALGEEILEIGSGAGALACWLQSRGAHVTCVEPAEEAAKQAAARGLTVHPVTLQQFQPSHLFSSIFAISSLIHIPKRELPHQIERIAGMLQPLGLLFVTFIEGTGEALEDPTESGLPRFFSKWSESEIDTLFSPHLALLESRRIPSRRINQTFLLRVYKK